MKMLLDAEFIYDLVLKEMKNTIKSTNVSLYYTHKGDEIFVCIEWPEDKDNEFKEPVKEIISTSSMELELLEYLNTKTGKKFEPVEQNLKLIRARLKDDFTVDKLKKMIDIKCSKWMSDPKMKEFLRPTTLFNAEKCAQYMGEVGADKPKDDFSSWSNPEFK